MADSENAPVKIHPIAPRVKQHHKKSHVGPDIQAYHDHHAKTVGEGSDEWWAQVRLFTVDLCLPPPTIATPCRWPGKPSTGIAPSRPFVLVTSKMGTSSGSLKVVSTLRTTASTDGSIPTPIRLVPSIYFYFSFLSLSWRSAVNQRL